MSDHVQKARDAVQWWMLCEACMENADLPCQNCAGLLDNLIAAVRAERVEVTNAMVEAGVLAWYEAIQQGHARTDREKMRTILTDALAAR